MNKKSSKMSPLFVVQWHDASHLHYDFRLEVAGVLKSWAVPKGPSLNPAIKRLAMHVEDHPYDYHNFEGIIPEGNYGAGTVMVWDEGNYLASGATLETNDKMMLEGLKKGHVNFVLNGQKLKGEFSLIRMKEKEWLLIKKKDAYSSTKDITKLNKSVLSQRSLNEIAHQ